MTDLDFEVGRHDVEIKFGELNVDISFSVTLEQFLDTLEHILDDTDVSDVVHRYVAKLAIEKYGDEKVFSDQLALDKFLKQLRKVME